MPVFHLTSDLVFPPAVLAGEDGIIAIGCDLKPERLLLGYRSGIFPWFNEEDPIIWHSPDPRLVLFPEKLRVSKSMRQVLRSKRFTITTNKDFRSVITNCSEVYRHGQDGTWLTKDMINAYCELHDMGYAISSEAWLEDELVGGFYGVEIGSIFFGESMFAKTSNASKAAFITFVESADYQLIDCQVETPHLVSLGAENISRLRYLELLEMYLKGG